MGNIKNYGNKVRTGLNASKQLYSHANDESMTLILAMHHVPHRFWPGTFQQTCRFYIWSDTLAALGRSRTSSCPSARGCRYNPGRVWYFKSADAHLNVLNNSYGRIYESYISLSTFSGDGHLMTDSPSATAGGQCDRYLCEHRRNPERVEHSGELAAGAR